MSGDVTGQGMTKPSPPPEAVLIRLAREAARIRAPAAAKAAGISPARWSQVETGYETRLGNVKPVRAPAGTLAHMAHAVGVSPERLEETGRPDAAVVLREIARREAESATHEPPPHPRYSDPSLRRIDEDPDLTREEKDAMIALAVRMRERKSREREALG